MISSTTVSEEYVYEDLAFGVSQTDQFFDIGGLSKDALILEAKRQLYRSRPLRRNESYANFTIDIKRTLYVIYSQTKVTVSADIVYRDSTGNSERFSENYTSKLQEQVIYENFFMAGDSIIDKKLNKGVVLDVVGKEKYRVLISTENNHYKSKRIAATKVFSTNKEYNGLKPGDKVEYKMEEVKGIVVGLGINGFLYQEKDSVAYYSDYVK